MDAPQVLVMGFCVVLLLWVISSVYSVKVYRFYKPSCRYCVESEPEWKKFKDKCMFSTVSPIDIDMSKATVEQQKLFENMGGRTVPKVVAVYSNGYRSEHVGERTAEGYLRWLSENKVNT